MNLELKALQKIRCFLLNNKGIKMSKNNCNRCGIKLGDKKYNPYNITFKQYLFGENARFGEGFYCLKCAEYFVNDRNQCKGGVWAIENKKGITK